MKLLRTSLGTPSEWRKVKKRLEKLIDSAGPDDVGWKPQKQARPHSCALDKPFYIQRDLSCSQSHRWCPEDRYPRLKELVEFAHCYSNALGNRWQWASSTHSRVLHDCLLKSCRNLLGKRVCKVHLISQSIWTFELREFEKFNFSSFNDDTNFPTSYTQQPAAKLLWLTLSFLLKFLLRFEFFCLTLTISKSAFFALTSMDIFTLCRSWHCPRAIDVDDEREFFCISKNPEHVEEAWHSPGSDDNDVQSHPAHTSHIREPQQLIIRFAALHKNFHIISSTLLPQQALFELS